MIIIIMLEQVFGWAKFKHGGYPSRPRQTLGRSGKINPKQSKKAPFGAMQNPPRASPNPRPSHQIRPPLPPPLPRREPTRILRPPPPQQPRLRPQSLRSDPHPSYSILQHPHPCLHPPPCPRECPAPFWPDDHQLCFTGQVHLLLRSQGVLPTQIPRPWPRNPFPCSEIRV